MTRKLLFLGGFVLAAIAIVVGIYFYNDYREKTQLNVGYCIMDARDETLYFRKNTLAGGLYRKDSKTEECQKINNDSPEDILVTKSAVLYTPEKDRLVRYDLDSGQWNTIKAPDSDAPFETSIQAFDPENLSLWEQKLKFTKPVFGEPVLFRSVDWGGTELFQYDDETQSLSAWVKIEGVFARQVAVKGSDIYICDGEALYWINKDTGEIKRLYGQDSLFIHSFAITEGNRVFVHAGRSLFLLYDGNEGDAPNELGIADIGPYLYGNKIYTVGDGELYMFSEDGNLIGKAAGFEDVFELSITTDGVFSYHLSSELAYHTYEELDFEKSS